MTYAPTRDPVSPPVRPNSVSILIFIITLGLVAGLMFMPNPPPVAQTVDKQTTSSEVVDRSYDVFIRKPSGPPSVKTGILDAHGQPVSVACNNCHTTKPPNTELRVGGQLTAFHLGMKGNHGNLTCVSCHNGSEGYQSLRLADSKSLPYTEVMQLCAQCHGPQYRDYSHGAHGGMTGYWDLSQGPRQRNNCIDCHDPHSPKYPTVRPAQGPRDRFQSSPHDQKGAGHE